MNQSFEKSVQIVNKRGLHARAAAKFVALVETMNSKVMVNKGNVSVTGASIMGLLTLSASINKHINISVSGSGAEKNLEELISLVERGFDE